jgi:hypothetical protein
MYAVMSLYKAWDHIYINGTIMPVLKKNRFKGKDVAV